MGGERPALSMTPAEQPRPRGPGPRREAGRVGGSFGRRVSQARFVLRLG